MDEEVYSAVVAEWRGGGLARCLAGEEPPIYPMPHPSRVMRWRERRSWIPWTATEEGIVRDLYHVQGYAALKDLLPGRSGDAIKSRARMLGVQAKRCGSRVRVQA